MAKFVYKDGFGGVSYAEDNAYPEYSDLTINMEKKLTIISAFDEKGNEILGNELSELKRKYEERKYDKV